MFIVGGDAKHYKFSTDTGDKEVPGRSHWTCGEPGWEEIADYALEWALTRATRAVPTAATA